MPRVGFWKESDHSNLPIPRANLAPWDGQDEFLFHLCWIEAKLWDIQVDFNKARQAWAALRQAARDRGDVSFPWEDPSHPGLLELEKTIRGYRGSSLCRVCVCRNGSYEYELDGWVWPEGYLHYLRDHNVTPNEEFRQWVLKKTY